MTAIKYKELDAAIIAAIAAGKRQFSEIVYHLHGAGLASYAAGFTKEKLDERFLWRIDRRLQALRKAGHIVFKRGARAYGGWVLR